MKDYNCDCCIHQNVRPAYHVTVLECTDYLPIGNVVPVVRCKDCIHCVDRKTYLRCVRNGFANGYEVNADGFCNYGRVSE